MTSAPRQNFPPVLRLKRRSEFRAVYDEGVRVAGDTLVLFVRLSPATGPRLGLTAARKVGTSVARNRVRRRLREAFRRNRAAFDSWDLVVNVRGGATRRTSREIEDELLKLARRAARAVAQRGPEKTA